MFAGAANLQPFQLQRPATLSLTSDGLRRDALPQLIRIGQFLVAVADLDSAEVQLESFGDIATASRYNLMAGSSCPSCRNARASDSRKTGFDGSSFTS